MFADVSSIFSGVGLRCEEFNVDYYPNSIFIYSAGLSVFAIWSELFLADISGDRFYNNTGRIPFLQEVREKSDSEDG